jgi:SAM-dependent methyltransferase
VLNNLTGTPQYLSWLARKLRPHVGDSVLEVGAGIGNIAGRLMSRRTLYMVGEKDALHLHALNNRFLRTPNVTVQRIDPEAPEDLAGLDGCFDTVLCLNVLEYLDEPERVLRSLRATLKPGGNIIVLVQRGLALFGSLDRSLGHKRRYGVFQLRQLLESQGFSTEQVYDFNRAGAPPWWAYSKVFGARNINKPVLKIFDKTVWIWRRLDWLMPWPGLSLIAVACKTGGEGAAPVREQASSQMSSPHAS